MGTSSAPILDLLASEGSLRFDQLEDRLVGLDKPLTELLLDLELKGQILRGEGDRYGLAN